ncbi:MAG TPA: hypothetical protein VMR50_04550 [Myxococcota bacterium]|nr:hypothetical protein [Myxococcota bacterium]
MRGWLLAFALVYGSWAGATRALAGDFTLPFGDGVCVHVDAPYGALPSPALFIGNVKCGSLCRSVAIDCAKYTTRAASCLNTLASDNLDYEKKECANNVDPISEKACVALAITDAAAQRVLVKTMKASELALCKVWGDACVVACQ